MKVVGFGDNVVDRYVNKNLYFPGGNAVNFAFYANKNGIETAYLGVFGDDAEADHIKYALTNEGIDISHCHTVKGGATERCDVNLIDGDRVFVPSEKSKAIPAPMVLGEKELDYLKGFDLIHSGCYAGVHGEIKKLRDFNSILTFDFSEEDHFRTDAFLNTLCPHLDFALFSCSHNTKEERVALQKKVHDLGTKYVLVTMGVEGQVLYDGNRFYDGVVKTLTPVDTMGAGDSFFTAFLMNLLKRGWKKHGDLSETVIHESFEAAAQFSADICMVNGAFGYEKPIK